MREATAAVANVKSPPPMRPRVEESHLRLMRVLRLYPLDRILAIERLHRGRDNMTFRADTTAGSYVVRCIRAADNGALAYRHLLLRALAQRGLPVAVPVATREGASFVLMDGTTHELLPFVSGTTFVRGRLAHAAAAATMLARYHEAVADCPASGARAANYPALLAERAAFYAPALLAERAAFYAPALQDVPRRFDVPEEDDVARAIPFLASQAAQLRPRLDAMRAQSLPRLVVHGDYRRGNLIFSGDKLVALLDFDRTCEDVRAADLAVALSNLTRSADKRMDMHPELVRAFIERYTAEQPITADERAALPVLILGKALVAALQRLRRFQTTEPRERAKRARKFVKHARRLRWLVEHRDLWGEALHDG